MKPVFRLLNKVAKVDLSVLLTGPSGVGKTEFARAIHQASPRADHPFITVDCGSVPDALLESELFGHTQGAFTGASQEQLGAFVHAHQGTLLLDEIGEASPSLQIALLRALETQQITPLGAHTAVPVDVRILATTSHNLQELITDQRFRPDLYYRIAVVVQDIPPLDAHKEDIPIIADRVLHTLRHTWKLPDVALSPLADQVLRVRDWPGNVRELENVLKRAAALAGNGLIAPEHLGASPAPQPQPTAGFAPNQEWFRSGPIAIHRDAYALPSLIEHVEALAIQRALDACHQNQSQAAKLLQMPRRTLVYKLGRMRDAAKKP